METDRHLDLESLLSYRFQDRALLDEALRHSSFVNEQPAAGLRDNERLEFLGDAVLNLAISHLLMARHPHLSEGELSRMRATLVNQTKLAKIGRQLAIGERLQLGKGELQTHGRHKNSILADALEALLAAVYLDGGFKAAYRLITRLFSDQLEARPALRDYKSRLQEHAQTLHGEIPDYRIVGQSGPDHDKTFEVCLTLRGVTTLGRGKSKKAAEQDAAQKALADMTRGADG